jgi:hypothetical protein
MHDSALAELAFTDEAALSELDLADDAAAADEDEQSGVMRRQNCGPKTQLLCEGA